MCGIAGLISRDDSPPDPLVLDRLAEALAHRGPDGRGRHVVGGIGLIQNRLSIIDLAGGRQPILDAEGNAIVANGEIYNYRELRAALPDQSFATGSDCEVPLHLFRRHGLDFVNHLRGMYALAIHHRASGRVVLARDPFGIKPLYYAEGRWGLAFASEPAALLAAGLVAPALEAQARAELLQMQFTCGAETLLAGIHRVAPGETLVIERGRIIERRHRPALPAGSPLASGSEEDLLARLDPLLTEAVDLHQRADVPYGMFLSGGIDSATVLALMARLNPRGVLAFTAGFPDSGARDERAHARALATATGATCVEVAVTEADLWQLLPAIARAMDDPAADYACLPTWKLAAEARKSVKVILSGEGGDELFAGYGRYRTALRPWPFRRPPRRTGTFDRLDVLRDGVTAGWRDRFAATCAAVAPGRTRLQAAQAADCADWLAHDLLTKADRCLMAHGIEGRVPLLDPVLADFAFTLPDRVKLRRGLGKWLLRRWLERALPAAQPFAPKRGFTVPVGEWIGRHPELGPLLARQPGIAEICRPGTVETLFAATDPATGFARWTLLFYALWHRAHILGHRSDGTVFETLADL